MYIDRIDLSLPQEDIQSILEAFASAASTLELLPSVGPVDRKHYAKLGLKNEALTLQIIEVGRSSRHLIPAGIDFEKIDRDLVAREQLRTLKIILQGLLDRVSDSMLLTGVDLYAAALSMYHCLRRNADTASLKSTVAELKKGFARPSRKKKEEQEQPAPISTLAPSPAPAVNQTALLRDPDRCAPVLQQRDAAATPDVRIGETSSSRGVLVPQTATTANISAADHHVPLPSSSYAPQVQRAPALLHFHHYGLPVLFSGDSTPTIEPFLR